MTRSRKRKLRRTGAKWAGMPLASAMLAGGPLSVADPADTNMLEEVVVTAQKRSEDLQKVPISMQVLNGEKLEQLQATSFEATRSFCPASAIRPSVPDKRSCISAGLQAAATACMPARSRATGMYLDETPVTTISNSLDLHVYDIERVEALAGPQGTLYGASSLSGTLRLITNKPDPTKFSAGYDIKGDKYSAGRGGGENRCLRQCSDRRAPGDPAGGFLRA